MITTKMPRPVMGSRKLGRRVIRNNIIMTTPSSDRETPSPVLYFCAGLVLGLLVAAGFIFKGPGL